ncbi:MAG: RNA polymerase sigma factor [Dermatophilaceae bacterium]|nr:sigma-70 family RNA polymerase sigma factor [Intrasporangiaceae bacterium]
MTSGMDPDEDVWADLLDGDADCFGVIWDRHRDRVFRNLCSAGVAAVDAEDMTAMAFLELWRRRDVVRFVDGSLLPWLLVTAQNVHRNAARSRRRYRAFLAKLPPPSSAADPADRVVESHSETVQRVRELMRTGSEVDRALLAMTALDDLTIREAAIALALSESAAKMRLSRLKARLRAGLADVDVREEQLR